MEESQTPKRLLRSRDDRYIGGVAAGIANYFSIDPTLVRVTFVVSLAFGGIGLLAYVALLALTPMEGPPGEPLPEISGQRRNLMIGGAVVFGSLMLLTLATGWFAEWIFGFGPGPVFGILLWTFALIAIVWLAVKALTDRTGPTAGRAEPSSGSDDRTTGSGAGSAGSPTSAAADSPSQSAPTAVMPRTAESPVSPRPVSTAGSIAGKVMTVIAVTVTALIGLSVLAIVATWTTAQFGGVPMALLVIVLGAAMIMTGIKGHRRLSLWLLAAALTVTIPMSIIALADLRIDGSYGSVTETPTLIGDIPAGGYSLAAGRMVVDLREYPFRPGETVDLEVDSGLGMTSVVVPDRVCLAGEVTGRAGLAYIRGREVSGVDISREMQPPAGPAPRLDLDADFKLGVLEVVDDTEWVSSGGADFDRREDHRFDRGDWRDSDSTASRVRADRACDPGPAERARNDARSGGRPEGATGNAGSAGNPTEGGNRN